MGRKWIALLLALALLTALTACGRDTSEDTAQEPPEQTEETVPDTTTEDSKEETSGETGTEPAPDSSEEENASAQTAAVISYRAEDHMDDDGFLLLQEHLALVQVTLENPDAADAINAVLQKEYDSRAASAVALLDQAKADKASAESYGGTFSGYAITDQVDTARLDEEVLSLVLTSVDATGGAHGSTSARALNFDLTTGKQLTFSSLTADRAALEARLTDAIAAQIAADPDSYYPDAANQLDGLVTEGGWYFSDDGLTVLCEPYSLAPFAAGVLRFTVPYEDLADLLDAQWLPREREDASGSLSIALADGTAPDLHVAVSESGAEMILSADGTVSDVRVRGVSSSDGVTWFAGSEYLALNRLSAGERVGITAMLPDVMTNVMVTYTNADGSTAAYGILESGKDGSVFLTELENVIF